MFKTVEDCCACEHHQGVQKVRDEANGIPAIFDILCGLPVRRRVEYIVKDEPGKRIEPPQHHTDGQDFGPVVPLRKQERSDGGSK